MKPIRLALLLLAAAALAPSPAAAQQEWETRLAEAYASAAVAFEDASGLDGLVDRMAERRFVLLGESSHGTSEYYALRDAMTRRLIAEHGFRFVGVEGDWGAIERINRYAMHLPGAAASAREAMVEYSRWPHWLWANEEFEAFVEWLHDWNADRPLEERTGLYGLDMQDHHDSMRMVLEWARGEDEELAERLAAKFDCWLRHDADIRAYAQSLMGGGEPCGPAFEAAAERLRERAAAAEDPAEGKAAWSAKQSTLAVAAAEGRVRAMMQQGPGSWNERAIHMHDAFLRIAERHGPDSRGVVWAHNTHVGDSRATQMALRGEVNIGALLRESAGAGNVFILGFAMEHGAVVAGPAWDAPMEVVAVPRPRAMTHEAVLALVGPDQFHLVFEDAEALRDEQLRPQIAQRAIGVVYSPPAQAYVPTVLPARYDGIVFVRETTPLSPLASGG